MNFSALFFEKNEKINCDGSNLYAALKHPHWIWQPRHCLLRKHRLDVGLCFYLVTMSSENDKIKDDEQRKIQTFLSFDNSTWYPLIHYVFKIPNINAKWPLTNHHYNLSTQIEAQIFLTMTWMNCGR